MQENKLRVIMNPNFGSMSEGERRRTISVDRSFLEKGPNGRVLVLKHLCDNYIKKSFVPSLSPQKTFKKSLKLHTDYQEPVAHPESTRTRNQMNLYPVHETRATKEDSHMPTSMSRTLSKIQLITNQSTLQPETLPTEASVFKDPTELVEVLTPVSCSKAPSPRELRPVS